MSESHEAQAGDGLPHADGGQAVPGRTAGGRQESAQLSDVAERGGDVETSGT